MQRKNICKFISDTTSENLSVSYFVLESDPDTMQKNILLTQHRLILTIQGEGILHFDNTQIPFTPGSLIFCLKGENFRVECFSPCEYMYIDFDGTRATELLHRFGINKTHRFFSGFDNLVPFWRESLSRAQTQTIDLAAESVLLYTFSRLMADTPKRDALINKILEISEEQFTNPALSLPAIAQELNYNEKYLSHFFKEKMGVNYSEYLRTLRIKYAVSLFDHGIDSVKNVSLLSGFTDPLYFSTVFKQSIGMSPREYKMNLRNNP